MSTERSLAELNAMEQDQMAWIRDTSTDSERMEFGDMEARVSRARLNDGWEWALMHQGNIVLQGQWAETRQRAKEKVLAFARRFMVDDIRN